MRIKSRFQGKFFGVLIGLSFLSASALGTTGASNIDNPIPAVTRAKIIYGRLSITGDKTILINGNSVRSGATIISGALLETPDEVGANLQLSSLGRIEMAPRTRLQLNFNAGSIEVRLSMGCLAITTAEGVEGLVNLAPNRTVRIDPKTPSTVDICSDNALATRQNATAPAKPGWAARIKSALSSRGFNALFLIGAAPFATAGWYANYCDGRPPVASPCNCCCL